MPTLLIILGYRVTIYFNDHPPPHVHVAGKGLAAIVEIGPGLRVRETNFPSAELRRVLASIEPHRPMLLEKWSEIHGD